MAMVNMTRRRMDIRDVGTLLQFGLMAVAPPVIGLCVFWWLRRNESDKRK